jgi:late competence protein required for DNA uptake (superfamily II DNA/RNA helicase)
MAQGRKGKLNYRCPRCLMREIDMDMLFDMATGEYYCLRCSFVGDEAEVRRLNAQFREKYPLRSTRLTIP